MARLESRQARLSKGSDIEPSVWFGSRITENFYGLGPATKVQKSATVQSPKNSSVSETCKVFSNKLSRSLTNYSGLLSTCVIELISSRKLAGENFRTSLDFRIVLKNISLKY